MKFENQVAVIAACGSQVGAASALQHLKEGAKVAFYYEDDVRLELFKDLTEEEKAKLTDRDRNKAVVQVAELKVKDQKLVCDRNEKVEW